VLFKTNKQTNKQTLWGKRTKRCENKAKQRRRS